MMGGRCPTPRPASLALHFRAHLRGPTKQTIGGIIASLLDNGWDTPHPERWTSPDCTTFLLSKLELLSDPSPLFRCFEASLRADFWLAADSGSCGLGLAGGCGTDRHTLEAR